VSQAREFSPLMIAISDLFAVEIAIQAMTRPDAVSTDENIQERQFKKVSVPYRDLELHGASKFLFIQIMTGLVMCGRPESLRIEWAPGGNHFGIDHESETVSASLMVVGHSEFLKDWDTLIDNVRDVETQLELMYHEPIEESAIEVPGMPEPRAHTFTSPNRLASTRALFVSLALECYDRGPEVDVFWRERPRCSFNATRGLWTCSARPLIVPKQRIVVPA
jgi:hypothetical protein